MTNPQSAIRNPKCLGQAMVELAVMGSLVVFGVAMLVRVIASSYFGLAAEQTALREAMKETRQDPCASSRMGGSDGTGNSVSLCDAPTDGYTPGSGGYIASPAYGGGSIVLVQDRRVPDPGSPFGGSRSPVVASSSINWGTESTDYRVTRPEAMPRVVFHINEKTYPYLGVGVHEATFERMSPADPYSHYTGEYAFVSTMATSAPPTWDEGEMLKVFCLYDKAFGSGDGTSGVVRVEAREYTGKDVPLDPDFEQMDPEHLPKGEVIRKCRVELTACGPTTSARLRGGCNEDIAAFHMRVLDPCSSQLFNMDNCKAQCDRIKEVNDEALLRGRRTMPVPNYCPAIEVYQPLVDRNVIPEPSGLDFGNYTQTMKVGNTFKRQETPGAGGKIGNTILLNEQETIERWFRTWDPKLSKPAADLPVTDTLSGPSSETWSTPND